MKNRHSSVLLLATTLPLVLYGSAFATPGVTGNTISWPDDGWYQVQSASDYASVCEGGTSCEVADGLYIVINHNTGERFENITVPEGPVREPPPAPVNARFVRYSDSTGELFWNREPRAEFTEVERQGVIIATTQAISFVDRTRLPGVNYTYNLTAISSDGQRSPTTTVSDGPGTLSPLNMENIDAVLAGINQLANNNAPVRLNPVIAIFRSAGVEAVQGLAAGEQTVDANNNALTVVTCAEGGSYDISVQELEQELEQIQASTQRLTFDNCQYQGDTYNGVIQFGVDGAGRNVPFVPNGISYIGYEDFSVSPFSGNGIKINGTATRHLRGAHIHSNNALGLADQMHVSYYANVGSIEVFNLELSNQGFHDHFTSSTPNAYFPMHKLNADLVAPWTNWRQLNISTVQDFQVFDSGNYTEGVMRIQDKDLNTLTIDAASGNPATFTLTLQIADTVTSEIRTWGDQIALPCLTEIPEQFLEEIGLNGCTPTSTDAPFTY